MTFYQKCKAAEEETGILCWFYENEPFTRRHKVSRDDGNLHINYRKQRAVFNIGQDLPLRVQNERMMAVLNFLKIKPGDHCLWSQCDIDEEEDEEICICCGSPIH